MSPHWRDQRALPIAWSVETGDGPLQGPLALEFLRGRRLDLFLAPDQLALLLDGERLRAVYRPGHNLLDVGDGPGQLSPRWRLLFLAVGDGLDLRWTAEAPLRCGAGDRPDVIGTCRVAIASPEAFHGTFLAGVEHPEFALVLTLIDRLVQASLAALLTGAGADGAPVTAGGIQARLTGLQPADLADALAPCGLVCRRLAVYTAHAPIEAEGRGAAPSGIGAGVPLSGHSEDLRRH